MSYPVPDPAFGIATSTPRGVAPLVLLFERDDMMAVPLLSQLRLAGYDVRAARTPVDLFDAAQKHAVALIVVDLSNAAASRREFWVALDAQRRGRATQVLTFRVVSPNTPPMADLDTTPHALADLEVGGPEEVPLLVAAVSQRVPLNAGQAIASGLMPGLRASPTATGEGLWQQHPPSPFASPAPGNPFSAHDADSPFDQPDAQNPFAQTQPRAQPAALPAAIEGPGVNVYGSPVSPLSGPAGGPGWTPHDPSWPGGSFAHMPAMTKSSPTPLGPSSTSAAGANGYADPVYQVTGHGPSIDRDHSGGYPPDEMNPYLPHASVADAWMPPDGVPPIVALPVSHGAATANERAIEHQPLGNGHRPAVHMGNPASPESFADDPPASERSTAPVAVPSQVSRGGELIRPEERALGAVLVEGALLSPQRLEVLAEIRHMLTTVDVDVKLGELALLFRFLSPDQLLAALLVSRRLITPEQIAALGRIKQEMGASGINYDLETLLVMFNIMSREDLERLRRELA